MATLACPRCGSTQVRKIADSPVKGNFEVYRCDPCYFVWRSNEDLSELDTNTEFWRDNVVTYSYEVGKGE